MLVAGTAANLQGVKFHAASSLAALLAAQGLQHQARSLLRGKLEATTHHPYWHMRLLLQLAVGDRLVFLLPTPTVCVCSPFYCFLQTCPL